MKFHTARLYPWADFLRMMQNAHAIRIMVGKTEYTGEFDMTINDDGLVTMAFKEKAPAEMKAE